MHHPHVPQGIEMHRGGLIAYSLGNFVFDAHTSRYMREYWAEFRKGDNRYNRPSRRLQSRARRSARSG
jgi:poly-gamma-glutamate synthesis protein (capsule biosynthesis protein)